MKPKGFVSWNWTLCRFIISCFLLPQLMWRGDSDSPAVGVKAYLTGVSCVIYKWPLWLHISLSQSAISCRRTMDVLTDCVQTLAASENPVAYYDSVNCGFLNHNILETRKQTCSRRCGLCWYDTTFEFLLSHNASLFWHCCVGVSQTGASISLLCGQHAASNKTRPTLTLCSRPTGFSHASPGPIALLLLRLQLTAELSHIQWRMTIATSQQESAATWHSAFKFALSSFSVKLAHPGRSGGERRAHGCRRW